MTLPIALKVIGFDKNSDIPAWKHFSISVALSNAVHAIIGIFW